MFLNFVIFSDFKYSFPSFFANFPYTAKMKYVIVISKKIAVQTYKFQMVKISKTFQIVKISKSLKLIYINLQNTEQFITQ